MFYYYDTPFMTPPNHQPVVLQPQYWDLPGECFGYSSDIFTDAQTPERAELKWHATWFMGAAASERVCRVLSGLVLPDAYFRESPQVGELQPSADDIANKAVYTLTRERLAFYQNVPPDLAKRISTITDSAEPARPLISGVAYRWVELVRADLAARESKQSQSSGSKHIYNQANLNPASNPVTEFATRMFWRQLGGSVVGYLQDTYAAVVMAHNIQNVLVPFGLATTCLGQDRTVRKADNQNRASQALPLPLVRLNQVTTYTGQGLDDPVVPAGATQHTLLRQHASLIDQNNRGQQPRRRGGGSLDRRLHLGDILDTLLPRPAILPGI